MLSMEDLPFLSLREMVTPAGGLSIKEASREEQNLWFVLREEQASKRSMGGSSERSIWEPCMKRGPPRPCPRRCFGLFSSTPDGEFLGQLENQTTQPVRKLRHQTVWRWKWDPHKGLVVFWRIIYIQKLIDMTRQYATRGLYEPARMDSH